MAILYSYPETLELLPEDMLIGTSTIRVAGKKKNITKNFTLELLKNFILDGNTGVQWGTITGTLSNQTDLQAALNAKQNSITLTTTGSTGPATLVGSTLNVPNYTGVSYTFTSPLINTAGIVTINQSSSTVDGYLSSIDWAMFNNKQSALSGTGLVKSTSGTISYITDNSTDWDTAYTNRITSLTTTGLGAATLIANVLNIPTPAAATFSSLTTTGSSGASTLITGVLNVPAYTLSGLGGQPLATNLTSLSGLTYAATSFVKMTAAGTFALDTNTYLTSAVTSIGMTVPSAFNVTPSTITSSGTFAITGAGVASQYVRGDGTLANFPTSTGGGASVSYYLNGSISQGTIGGVAYKEMNSVPVIGAGTDFTINADGYIAQFITDVGDPNKLLIPAGNWNFETYFSASSGGGSPRFYIELYKYDGPTFTLIATNSATPEYITGGTSIDLYFTALAIPPTTLLATDRLAVRFYVIHSGRTITMHTENSHLSQIITTFSTGLTALNGLTSQVQYFAVGTSGTDFNISSATDTHTFNLPTASATNRGALSSADWSTFNGKFTLPSLTSGSVLFSNGTTIAQDNANFFWDNTNKRLNIGGITSNTARFGIKASGALSTDIALRVRNSADTADLMIVNGLGNVGIGTSSPTHQLNVFTTIADTGILLDSSTNPAFIIKRAGVERLKLSASGAIGTINGLGNGLVFQTDSVERMRINASGNVLIGTTTNFASSKLTVESTTQGFLPPRMTTTEKNAIATPTTGLVVFDTTLNKLCVFVSPSWQTITSI
jgi:hypothetical protein